MSPWRGGLGLGAIALGAAVASGSRPLGVVGIGFLLAAFTARKQALHDMVAGTLVVNR